MFESRIKIHPVFAGLLGLLLSFSVARGGTLTLSIKPTNSGTVAWQTTSPSGSGVFSGTGGQLSYTMNQTYITLTFYPNTGGSITKVMTNEGDDTSWVLSHNNTDNWPGPGENSKTVTVTFSATPSSGGTFNLTIKPTNSGTVTWSTVYPTDGGTLSGAGGTFPYVPSQTYIQLVFHPNPQGTISSIVSDQGNEMKYLMYGNTLFWSGSSSPSKTTKPLTVTFSVPDPTGNFPLTFPTNNTQLTAIADVSGTYTGTTPRAYNVTIAQDESGKLQANGTVQGVQVKGPVRAAAASYSDTLNLNIGAISTVNNQPTINLKSKLDGLIDTNPASITGSGQLAVGSGTNGVSGTTSYSGKVGNYTLPPVKNQPTTIATPSTAIHKAWGISLSLTNKINAKTLKAYIGATGVLTRPDGDVIRYPEQVVKYSTKTGYSLNLKSGTNTTLHVVDKKSTITITGLMLTKSGNTWIPTGGSLSYQFLGQKGTGSLTNFLQQIR